MQTNLFEKSVVGEVKLTYEKTTFSKMPKIRHSNDMEKYIRSIFPVSQINHREHAYLILLNRANDVLGYYLLSMGGLAGTIIDPKLVFQSALLSCAHSIVLCHNHPSGNLTPSQADKNITKKISSAGKILDIPLLDHLIISQDSYYSFADEGLL